MGGSSSKKRFFWQKKSPVDRAWAGLKGALPARKRKRTSIVDKLNLDKLRKDKKHLKGFSLKGHRKEPTLAEKLGNLRKQSVHSVLKEDGGRGGERKKKLSLTVNTKEDKEIKGPQHRPTQPKQRLKELFKSIHS